VSGYNWRDTLGDFAAVSGVLAGFTLAFVVFILGWSVATTPLVDGITWANVGVLFNGISAALFIAASELFLGAKENNVWALPDRYEKQLADGFKGEGKDWQTIRAENLEKCVQYEEWGRKCYNVAIFLMFLALFFVIGPSSIPIAIFVSALGIGLELFQMKVAGRKRMA
jgi:hypothetical protein